MLGGCRMCSLGFVVMGFWLLGEEVGSFCDC